MLDGVDYESATGFYEVVNCSNCSIKITNPVPTSETVGNLYKARSSADFAGDGPLAVRLRAILIRRRFRTLLPLLKTHDPKVLEFGCGDGVLVKVIADYAPSSEVTGVDFHSEPPKLIKKSNRINSGLFISNSS